MNEAKKPGEYDHQHPSSEAAAPVEPQNNPDAKPGFFGRIKKTVTDFLMAADIEEAQQEKRKAAELQEPIIEEVSSRLAVTYRGELFGMTNRQTRPSNDRSMIKAVAASSKDEGSQEKSNFGVITAVCDGAGKHPAVGQLAERVVEVLAEAADIIFEQTSNDEQKDILTKAMVFAVQMFNEYDKNRFEESKDLFATTVTAYIVAGEQIVGVHAGDSELHKITFDQGEDRLIASCLSSRKHHIGNNLIKCLRAADDTDTFDGQHILEPVKSGDILISWSDGFAKYWFEDRLSEDFRYDQDIDQLQRDNENRVGEAYQKSMTKLMNVINEEVIKGRNPVDRLLREAQEEAVRSTRLSHNKKGYHDDISLIITLLQ